MRARLRLRRERQTKDPSPLFKYEERLLHDLRLMFTMSASQTDGRTRSLTILKRQRVTLSFLPFEC